MCMCFAHNTVCIRMYLACSIRQHGSAACVGMVVVAVYHNTMEMSASVPQAEELVNEPGDEKERAIHHTGLTFLLHEDVLVFRK